MMSLKVVYDQQADVLRLLTSEKGETGSSLFGQDDVVLDLAKEDGYDIVGIAILGASAYLPLGKQGYDTETDTLTLGCSVSDPAMTTENGDLAAYWQVDEKKPRLTSETPSVSPYGRLQSIWRRYFPTSTKRRDEI